MFRVGPGTDPFGSLRTGSRWTRNDVDFVLAGSDYTTDVAAAAVDAALVGGFGSWNGVRSSSLAASRIADAGTNFDVLDGTLDAAGNCLSLIDVTSPNIDLGTGLLTPEADIVVGGWLGPAYCVNCLGEQFCNSGFAWTDTDAVYLDFSAPIDIETIAVHEDGHAHGLGHFGGPIRNQPFQLLPNVRCSIRKR